MTGNNSNVNNAISSFLTSNNSEHIRLLGSSMDPQDIYGATGTATGMVGASGMIGGMAGTSGRAIDWKNLISSKQISQSQYDKIKQMQLFPSDQLKAESILSVQLPTKSFFWDSLLTLKNEDAISFITDLLLELGRTNTRIWDVLNQESPEVALKLLELSSLNNPSIAAAAAQSVCHGSCENDPEKIGELIDRLWNSKKKQPRSFLSAACNLLKLDITRPILAKNEHFIKQLQSGMSGTSTITGPSSNVNIMGGAPQHPSMGGGGNNPSRDSSLRGGPSVGNGGGPTGPSSSVIPLGGGLGGGPSSSSSFIDYSKTGGSSSEIDTNSVYQAMFALWLLTSNEEASNSLKKNCPQVIELFADTLRTVKREKVVRVSCLALSNMLKYNWIVEVLCSKRLDHSMSLFEYEKWRDEDLYRELRETSTKMRSLFATLSNFERYRRELDSGRLRWSSLHTEAFWQENYKEFESQEFKAVKQLVSLLRSTDNATLAVACFDIGEFAHLHPIGRQILQRLRTKDTVVHLMNHHSRDVSREALLCVQKLMLDNWRKVGTNSGDNQNQNE